MKSVKSTLLILLACLVSSPPADAVINNPEKIGIAALARPGSGAVMDKIGFPFYYTWGTRPIADVRESTFVPIVSHADRVRDVVPRGSGHLLGFNEPFRPDQYMSPDRALDLWPLLMAHNLRLGSPATSPGPSTLGPNSWLGQFMSKAKARNYRVDFIAVHYYSSDGDVEKFRYFLEKVHETYGKPIWVTEWALHDHNRSGHTFTTAEMVDFAKRSLEMLDNLTFVERHMWYKTHYKGAGDLRTHILESNNALNDIGEVFYRAIRGANFGYETIDVPDNIVPNPSFEDREDAQWQYYWRLNTGQAQVTSGTAHTGINALRLGTGAAQASNDITYRVKPGRTYQLNARAKLGNAAERAWIGIKTFSDNGTILTNTRVQVSSTSFANVQSAFTVPGNAERVIVSIYKNPGSSFVYVDDVAVVAK